MMKKIPRGSKRSSREKLIVSLTATAVRQPLVTTSPSFWPNLFLMDKQMSICGVRVALIMQYGLRRYHGTYLAFSCLIIDSSNFTFALI